MDASTPDPDRFLSVEDGPETELKIKGSRFLGQVFRVEDIDAADAALTGVRKRYHDATHHCWARRLGKPGRIEERYEDDGEPSGTAGPPILAAAARDDLVDLLVVVTRYYGGTKLGTGGLVRAYGDAAREALAAAPRRTLWHTRVLRVAFNYDDLGTVESAVAKAGDGVLDVRRRFEPAPELDLTVKRSRADALEAALIEATAGRVRIGTLPPG